MQKMIKQKLKESAELKLKVADELSGEIEQLAKMIITSFKNGGKLLLCGNGGSAADSQHIETELVHQFEIAHRKGLPAISLTTNTSTLTAIGNDWGFDRVYERQVECLGVKEKDVLIGITTSGNSKNILLAFEQAKKNGTKTAGLLGKDGGKAKDMVDLAIVVPSNNTARVQESHIAIMHTVCFLIEEEMFGKHEKDEY